MKPDHFLKSVFFSDGLFNPDLGTSTEGEKLLERSRYLKWTAFWSIALSTFSVSVCLVTFPMAFLHVQFLHSETSVDIKYCKSKSSSLLLLSILNDENLVRHTHANFDEARMIIRAERDTKAPRLICCTCHRGKPGKPGMSGVDGRFGADGLNGNPGEPGYPAPDAVPTTSGIPPPCPCEADMGEEGERGERGRQGPSGQPGPKGNKGKEGEDGAPGRKGSLGRRGSAGPRGKMGHPGSTRSQLGPGGNKGLPGGSGQPGRPGKTGPPGKNGRDGHPGSRGISGTRGTTGRDGMNGNRGPDGDPGHLGSCQHCPGPRVAPGY